MPASDCDFTMSCRNKGASELMLSSALLATVELAIVRSLFPTDAAFVLGMGGVKNVDFWYKSAVKAHGEDGMREKLQVAWEGWLDTNTTVGCKRTRDRMSMSAVESLASRGDGGGAGGEGEVAAVMASEFGSGDD